MSQTTQRPPEPASLCQDLIDRLAREQVEDAVRFEQARFNHFLLPPMPDYRVLKRRIRDCMEQHAPPG